MQIRGCRKIDEPGLAISQATFFFIVTVLKLRPR
jgi:hypothetical protein